MIRKVHRRKWALGSITTNIGSGSDRIPVELFQILKESVALNMPANLENSAVAIGLEKVSFPVCLSQRKARPKNVQTAVQLCSFHMLARLCSKSFKLGFSSIWTENFQMYKLGFEEAEESEIKFQHLLDHGESKRIPEKHLLLLLWLC